jgi:peptidoglycan/LPS O-acetylase OafA/YrhL
MTKDASKRYDFLDFLRFAAAFAVVSQHVFQRTFKSFGYFTSNYFNMGVFGVTIFFLVSGFIIPASIEKSGSLAKFWRSRLFRLFPFYLAVIFASLLLIQFGLIDEKFPTWPALIANIVMFAKFLGQPLFYGSFWTLSIEMIFYTIVSVIFVAGLIKRSSLIAYAAMAVTFLLGVVGTTYFGLFDKGWGTCLNLSTMFVGTVLYRLHKNEISPKEFYGVFACLIFVTLNITFWNLTYRTQPMLKFVPYTAATLGAFALFLICYYFRNLKYPSAMVYLGVISYSIYLNQDIIYRIIPKTEYPVLTAAIWLAGIFVLSVITYTYIEKPFIKLGRGSKQERSAVATAPVQELKEV